MARTSFLSTIAKWSAIEHRLEELERKTLSNSEKVQLLLASLSERIVALEADRIRVDQKIEGVAEKAESAAKTAATLAATNARLPYIEKIGRLDARLESWTPPHKKTIR